MPTTVESILQSYRINKRSLGLSDDTIERVVLNMTMYARDMNITRVGQISTDNIVEWGELKLQAGVRHSTLYTYYNSIRAVLRHVESMRFNHDVDYSRVKSRPNYKQKKCLRPFEIRRIINSADPQTAILIRLMYTSGMRLSEALSIRNIHLEGGLVLNVIGKGGEPRPVMVTKDLLSQLRTLSLINGGDCFVDPAGDPLSRKKAYYYITKAMTSAGFAWAHPHILRHSFCTELLRKGVDITKVSKMMGHANIAVTQIYTHLVTDDIEKAHKMLTTV